jgi:hypothetical protein
MNFRISGSRAIALAATFGLLRRRDQGQPHDIRERSFLRRKAGLLWCAGAACAIALAVGLLGAAHAQQIVTYQYTGPAFNTFNGPTNPIPSITGNVTATVTYTGPVGNNGDFSINGSDVVIGVLNYSLSAGGNTISSNPNSNTRDEFDVGGCCRFNVQNGVVAVWDLVLSVQTDLLAPDFSNDTPCNSTLSPCYMEIFTFGNGSQTFDNLSEGFPRAFFGNPMAYNAAYIGPPGVWTLTSRQVAGTPPLQITTTSLPSAASGQPYPPTPITATGGSGSGYNWSVVSGSLPPGFTPSAEGSCGSTCTDVFLSSTGTPAAPVGSYPFTIQVTDAAGNLVSKPLTIIVQTGTRPPLQITTSSLPSATAGQSYGPAPITATGGSGNGYNWTIASGSLPPGFSLGGEDSCGSACTDVFLSSTGTPAAPQASYSFAAQVTDSAGNLATRALTLVVMPCQLNFAIRPYPGPPYSGPLSINNPTSMNATFTPTRANGLPMGLLAAATACGYTGFNWQQYIDSVPISNWVPNILSAVSRLNLSPLNTLQAPPSFNDPPFGGYTYEPGYVTYPFYFPTGDLTDDLLPCTPDDTVENPAPIAVANQLRFQDCPSNPALSLLPGASVSFTTSLVGVLPCPTGAADCGAGVPTTPLFTWTWQSTFNGLAGGVSQTQSIAPPDPSSGTGGVTITSINGVHLPSPVSPSQFATTASGLAYSRVTQSFNGTVTLKNISDSAISGPLQIFFTGLTDGVTLANATGDLSGTPYVTVPAASGLAPGQSITVNVQFKNPSNATINFTPAIYSGSIG